MKLKNYQEDLVLYVADLVLQDQPDIDRSESFLHDVAAYTLNRLPPRYIQSERGFTRLAVDHWIDGNDGEGLASLVEVLLLVHKAIETIRTRRRNGQGGQTRSGAKEDEGPPDALGYWHNLPYLIGRVVDADTRQPLPEVSVSVLLDGEPAEGAEGSWQNPYRTSQATKGFFSFLPRPDHSRAKTKDFALRIVLEHPEYEPVALERTLQTQGEYTRQQVILSDKILNLETIALKKRG
ncbi:MAG: late competence development ComFB family protein [Spirochaetales bacterium]|nr:late competence development ComFB family protein [Spirochaetales bacterium]